MGEMDGRSGLNMTTEDIENIEEELQELAGKILTEWNRRQTKSKLEEAIYVALATPFNWGNNDLQSVLETGLEAVTLVHNTVKMKGHLPGILVELLDALLRSLK